MPDVDGEEVLKYIDETNQKIGVINRTRHPDFVKNIRLLHKTYDYITKPFNIDYLNNTVLTKVVLLYE